MDRKTKGWLGAALVVLGAVMLVGQIVGKDMLDLVFLPGLGIMLLAAGIGKRNCGLIVLGGIMAGIGLGTVMLEAIFTNLEEPAGGGVFLICFALGWVSVAVASSMAGRPQTWAYIPAVIMLAIGVPLVFSSVAPEIVRLTAQLWPVLIIVAGALMLRRRG